MEENIKLVKGFEIAIDKDSYTYLPKETMLIYICSDEKMIKEIGTKQNAIIINGINTNLNIRRGLKSDKIHLIIKLNDNYDDAKKIAKILLEMQGIITNNKEVLLGTIINSNSSYFSDIIDILNYILIDEWKAKYEYIYDRVCEKIDNDFSCKHYCDFKGDKCIANREKTIKYEDMGCCYYFEWAPFWSTKLTKNEKICDYFENGKCKTKNLTCKLFTCKHLRKQKIEYKIEKILLLDVVFNKKQQKVITDSFFITREEFITRLLEKNNSGLSLMSND